MNEGEVFDLIELDQGDGWTRVRRQNTFEEGFVPTTYIETTLFDPPKDSNDHPLPNQPESNSAK